MGLESGKIKEKYHLRVADVQVHYKIYNFFYFLAFIFKVINDSRLQIICGENSTETNMMTYHSVKNWVFPVFNQNSYENFKNQLNFTDLEMVSFYSNFLSNINFAEDVIKNEYNCVNSCESEYLAMLQWGQGRITLSPPKIINETTNSLFFWESSKFDGKFKLK